MVRKDESNAMMESKLDELKNVFLSSKQKKFLLAVLKKRWRAGEVQRKSLQENRWDHVNK